MNVLLDIHLDPNHKSFMLLDAPTAETVRDLLMMAGFGYFLDLNIHLVTPVSDLLKRVSDMPTIY